MSNISDFYGEKLRLARLLNGFTQQELGEKICASRQFVHQLESDTRTPAGDVLEAICEVLYVKKSFFNQPICNDVKFEQCHFRKRKTTPVGIANRVLAFSTIFEQFVEFANRHLELPIISLPNVNLNNRNYSLDEIEKAALDCRSLWGLGDGPISNVTRALENAGIIITQFRDVSDKVDALSVNRKFPIIIRNEMKESPCRLRFDLAHECGHFVLHDGIETGDNITESEADKFASSFLFPRKAFITEFPDFRNSTIKWKYIYELKIRWGLSARAIIYKAHQHNLITAQQFRWANVYLNKTGQSKTEKFDEKIKKEEPELLVGIFDTLRDQLGISYKYIADYLSIDSHLLSSITSITPEKESYLNNVLPLGSRI